eukprot:CAMPEP_0177620920 /NCGR_PEP_ID=MMETSP0419_2-20121207/27242_1 /TAXON_ID=582737 /ORGANISM="Tetraselmis sp., Strain GSL018" /LENGTH=56 /DNA_ID=CAMNT_0019120669 /DNA_START=68 /DNA_END=238 /DNA_ORIENTATION=-
MEGESTSVGTSAWKGIASLWVHSPFELFAGRSATDAAAAHPATAALSLGPLSGLAP